MAVSPDRLEIMKRAEEYERAGLFDCDLEDDPPTVPLKAGTVDYTLKKLSTRISSEIANYCAKAFFDRKIRKGELVIKNVIGLENYMAIDKMGAVITANHFHPFDNYAIFKAIEKPLGRRRLYKIIREGNYTSFPGLFGYFFRHCNTLPLGSSLAVYKELLEAVDILLGRGEKILIYPEQALWWNYKKPRPLKSGAFNFAVRSSAPVLPIFITMEDTEKLDGYGYPIQALTIHIHPAIFPDPNLSNKVNAKMMSEKNFAVWEKTYEEFYKTPLEYLSAISEE